ncbi:MAG TPA: MFS transporter [Kofleriaceae bacterium]|nr:MFS transporter [Kofleriaceae bacterium]
MSAPRSPWRVFGIASLAVFLVSIDATVLYAAFPALRRSFPAASAGELSWVLNGYTVVYAALLVPAGRLADLRGRKRTFEQGLVVFLLASLACGLAPSVPILVAARVVQAVGAALLLPSSLAIVLAAFPATRRAVVVSLWGAVSGLAAAIGPGLGAAVVEHAGWAWAFFLNLPLGAFAWWRARRTLDESRNLDAGAPLDVPGVAMIVVGVAAVAFALVHTEVAGWASPQVLAPLAGGLLLLAGFVGWARRAPAPAIDLSLFDDRSYRYVNLATLTFGIGFAMMFFSFFAFMTGIWGYSVALAGLAMTPGPAAVVPSSIVGGRLAARLGHKPVLVVGCLLVAAGAMWAFAVPGVEPDFVRAWLPGQLIGGVGVGLALPSLSAAAVARLPPSRFGVGSAVNQATRQIGAVLGVALAVALLHGTPTIAAFGRAYLWQAAFALATAVACLAVDTRPRQVAERR